MFQIIITGHGGFPTGCHEAIKLITGDHDNVHALYIDEKRTHDDLEADFKNMLDKHDNVIVFADFSGGAPHKIAARAIAEAGKEKQFVVSGAPLSFLIQLVLMTPSEDLSSAEVKEQLKNILEEANATARVMGGK